MNSNKVLLEYSLPPELWAMKRCFLLPSWNWHSMELISGDIWFEASSAFPHCLLTHLVQTAPSQVSGVMKERVLQRSVELSWQEPEHPNGVITEYEIKYYEKVSAGNRKQEMHHGVCLVSSCYTADESWSFCQLFGGTSEFLVNFSQFWPLSPGNYDSLL